MPPRYAYWTILIDATPTAFRARDREELLPTLHQLRRTNPNVELKWFANGRLWDTPEQAQWARRNMSKAKPEGRGREWRPGGTHKDPRARFAKKRDARSKGPREAQRQKADGDRPQNQGPGPKPGAPFREGQRPKQAKQFRGAPRPKAAGGQFRDGRPPGSRGGRRSPSHHGPRKPRS
ncbi:MAG: hypothetical protein AB7F99_02945 [Vicinamibacterales bacterium]